MKLPAPFLFLQPPASPLKHPLHPLDLRRRYRAQRLTDATLRAALKTAHVMVPLMALVAAISILLAAALIFLPPG
jgi:hypothetical protein